ELDFAIDDPGSRGDDGVPAEPNRDLERLATIALGEVEQQPQADRRGHCFRGLRPRSLPVSPDRRRAPERSLRRHELAALVHAPQASPSSSNNGNDAWSDTGSNVTFTRAPICTASGSAPITFVITRGPSSRSTSATTNGNRCRKERLGFWRMMVRL